jgi:3-phosphoshikimate 1-carboxyvinyltransferase
MRIEPVTRLVGELTPPPDKSISHRAALLAAMCERPVRVHNYLRSADTSATLAAMAALGAEIDEHEAGGGGIDLSIRGVGLLGAREPPQPIDVRNAGTLLRLLPGWLAGQGGGRWTIDGDESIRRRPVDRVAEPLRRMGARVECRDGRLPPIVVSGAELQGARYELPVASAQVKSCVLLAGLLAAGATVVVERLPTRDHMELMLAEAGVRLGVERASAGGPATVSVEPVDELHLGEIGVPADFSSAAFFVCAATLVPGATLVLRRVGVNPTRTGLLRAMERMGAKIELANLGSAHGEHVADLAVGHAPLQSTVIEAAEVPLMIDELPLVALLAAFAEGETVVRGAEELRHKESDRIATVVEGLRGLGADIEASPDGFRVTGTGGLRGGTIDSVGDHRLAMLAAVAGLASREGVEIRGFEAAEVSYPGFLTDLALVGGSGTA